MPKDDPVRTEFQVHILNDRGKAQAHEIAAEFTSLLNTMEAICGAGGREMALVRTHLEQAAFYAKRAMAMRPEHQE